MLNNIRRASNSFLIRILLGMIVFAFVGWVIKDVLQTTNNADLVTFSGIQNITEKDFAIAKVEEMNNIQKQTTTNLSEAEIKQLDIDNMILQKLINNNIMNHLVRYYDLDLSEDTVIQFIKEAPQFKNEQGIFDSRIFQDTVKNSYYNEAEYLLYIKEQMLKDTVLSSFAKIFQAPEIMIKYIVNYMAEVRIVDLVQVNLKHQSKNLTIPSPTINQLQHFYQNHQELFEIAEKRSFSYIKISNQILKKKINITRDELLNFYNENKQEFDNKSLNKVKPQVIAALQQKKLDELNMEFIKNLEDDIAAGLNLVEITKKYELPIQNMDNVSYQDLVKDKTGIAEVADSIFELAIGELSYPIELQEQDAFIFAELKSIQPSKVEAFTVIKDQIVKLWCAKYLSDLNLETFENFAKEYKLSKVDLKNLTSMGITVKPLISFSRSDIEYNTQLPTTLLLSIFQTKIGANSPVFQLEDKAYFACVQSMKIDKQKAQKLQQHLSKNIANTIINDVMAELIDYIAREHKMKINTLPNNLQ